MNRHIVITAVLLLATPAFVAGAAAPARGPSTQEERDKTVQLAKLLETTPWSDEAKQGRQWLHAFLDAAPDITVKYCLSLFGSAEERKGIPAELLDQHMFSSAAYILRNPGVGAGSTPAFLAGLEGTLAAYSAWRAHGGIEAVPRLDQLLEMKANGSLESYVRGQARSCI